MISKVAAGLAIVICLASCSSAPVVHGVPNLQKLRENYYRSGQPEDTDEAWRYISQELHVTDVIKLTFEDEGTDDLAERFGVRVHHLAIEPTSSVLWWLASGGMVEVFRPDAGTMGRIKRVIRDVRDDGRGRVVLIHCKHGRDRTGLVSGMVLVFNGDSDKGDAWQYVLDTGFREIHAGLFREWEAFDPESEVR